MNTILICSRLFFYKTKKFSLLTLSIITWFWKAFTNLHFYALATKHLGIGMSVGWLVSTQISKKFGASFWKLFWRCHLVPDWLFNCTVYVKGSVPRLLMRQLNSKCVHTAAPEDAPQLVSPENNTDSLTNPTIVLYDKTEFLQPWTHTVKNWIEI